MLTLFTIPKPFQGHIGVIQRNAIESWSRFQLGCEVVLCSDEAGTAEVAAEFGAKYLPSVARNEYGTPLLNSAFDQVAQMASHSLMCYVNADIVFLSDFAEAFQRIQFPRFLMIGRRWDIDITRPWDFERPDWEERLRNFLSAHGTPHGLSGMDYFVFRRDGFMEKLPPFAVGRPWWDSWFLYHARQELGIPVIDASRVTKAIHQNHDYSHVPSQRGDKYRGPEGDRNFELLGSSERGKMSILDATHIMTSESISPAYKLLISELGFNTYLRRCLSRLFELRIQPLMGSTSK